MKKLFSLFAALTLSVGQWAEAVSYLAPVYNDPTDVTKGIKGWIDKDTDATPITSSSSTWGGGGMTWLVVNSDVTISQRVTCNGDVHLILADGAKLNATQGITVSGSSSSLTIYAQTKDIAQMGKLIADATSVEYAAGIGGGGYGDGSNITINGGIVEATSGERAAGIGGGEEGSGYNITINGGIVNTGSIDQGAGIGGGTYGFGSNITINGGEVTAAGGHMGAAGIGGGMWGVGSNITINGGKVTAYSEGSGASGIGNGADVQAGGPSNNIFVATSLQVKAGNTVIAATRTATTDIANDLAGKQYVTIMDPLPDAKTDAIAAVNAEISETDNDNVKAIATNAVIAINAATTIAEVNTLKSLAIAAITSAKAAYGEAYTEGYDAGDAAVRAELPTEGYDGPAVIITKGEKVLILFNPEKVEYQILEAD